VRSSTGGERSHEAPAVEADLVIGRILVPFASHSHVFHSVQGIFHRLSGKLPCDSTYRRPAICLIFLAAKTPAEPLHIDLDLMHRQTRYATHGTLNRRRALCRRINANTAILGWYRVCTLSLDVEMFLSVLLSAALKNVFAVFECSRSIAKYKFLRRHYETFICSGDARIRYRFERFDIGSYLLRGLPRKFFALGDNDCDRHSLKVNFTVSQQGFVRHNAADLILTDQIFSRNDLENTFRLFCFSCIYRLQLPMSDRRIKNTRIQRPLNDRNIVQINRLAANV